MGFLRVFFWILGACLVLGALASLFLQAGLSRWVPLGMAAAGLILIFGLLVMGAANAAQPTPVVRSTVVMPGARRPLRSRVHRGARPFAGPGPPVPGETRYTSVGRSTRVAPDGTRVEGTVRSQRVVRRRPRRIYTSKQTTVRRIRPGRAQAPSRTARRR
jgi:hypothetical protein